MDGDGRIPRLEASFQPGIREYYTPNYRMGLSLPLWFFGTISVVLLTIGMLMHIFANQLKNDFNIPIRQFSSCLLTLGTFLFVISFILSCEAALAGNCGNSDVENDEERQSLLPRSASVSIHPSEMFDQDDVSTTSSRASNRVTSNPIPIITISPCTDNPSINDNSSVRDKASSLP